MEAPERVDYMDVSPKQTVSVAGALIPFLEHDDANRALMGANMQRQAVPLIAPRGAAGRHRHGGPDRAATPARWSLSPVDGVVESVDGRRRWCVREREGEPARVHRLRKFIRSNQGTCINQRPIVMRGQRVHAGPAAGGQLVAPSRASWRSARTSWWRSCPGRAATSRTRSCSARSWCATTSSPRSTSRSTRSRRATPSSAPRRSRATSRTSARTACATSTRTASSAIGAEVKAGDILVGKITPKGETELTAEERLLRAIFGEKAREVKDTSLRVPHGERGKVVDVRVFERDAGRRAAGGRATSWCGSRSPRSARSPRATRWPGATATRAWSARILPVEDMPFLPDGRPVEIILNPLGVPSRMNVGQILETHLGWAADALGRQVRDAGLRRRDRRRHPRAA